jgi:hypothetical protein
MKKIILLLALLQNHAFGCMCAAELQEAFEEFEQQIFVENVDVMNDRLKTMNEETQNNIDALIERIDIYTRHVRTSSLLLKELTNSVKKEETLKKVDI